MTTLVGLAAALERVTPMAVTYGIARMFGALAFRLSPRIQRHTTANMSVVLNLPSDDPRVHRLARRSVMAYAEHVVEFLRTYRMSVRELLQVTTRIEGYEHFKAMHDLNRGGIMVSAHFGNWEWCGGLVSMDHPTYAVAETFPSRAVTHLLDHMRASQNVRSIQLGGAARQILRVLQRGDYVALLADRPTPGDGVQVQFFGRPVWVPAGAAALAERAGSPLLVGGVIRNPDHTYSAIGMPPILVDPDRPRAEAIREAMQRVMSDLEALIRKAPEQWYMFRRMWTDESCKREAAA
jgi:lauroyl/myristoyl acyltransferase